MPAKLRLGTRGSPLALAQARMTADALVRAHGWDADAVEIVTIVTTGDRVQDRPLAEIGGKALWTKAIDAALLAGEIDFGVHSLKDVETIRPDSIAIAACLPRADPRDRLIGAASLEDLKPGARLGTSSPRRAAQVLHLRPDLEIVPMRGNVATRITKVGTGEADATFLAAAGLDRLGEGGVGVAVPMDQMLPACGQAIVAIEARSSDAATREALAAIGDDAAMTAALTERAFLAALGGGCHSPVGAHFVDGVLTGELLTENGREAVRGAGDHPADLARQLLDRASAGLRALFAG
ncbi:MAG TPA: hydroxymethylbilane synthase [Sphingomonas sp.]|nr:hydroxymethylbilane synthase [Sphingomonas sp.]